MTRVAFIADVHFANHRRFGGVASNGLNERAQIVATCMARAMHQARKLNVEQLFVLGDLFHTTRPSPALIWAVQRTASEGIGTPPIVSPGNHDSTRLGESALDPLRPVMGVEDRDFLWSTSELEVLLLPFRPGRPVNWLRGAMAKAWGEPADDADVNPPPLADPPRIVAGHFGVAMPSSPPYLYSSDEASIQLGSVRGLAKMFGVRAVVAGHWHPHTAALKEDEPAIVQVGALAPTGFGDLGLTGYGSLVVIDSSGQITRERIAGPRFLKIGSRDALMQALEKADEKDELFIEWKCHPDTSDDSALILRELEEAKAIRRGAVILDSGEAAGAARSSAMQARSAESIGESLSAFVDGMQLGDDIDRAAVLSRARDFLELD